MPGASRLIRRGRRPAMIALLVLMFFVAAFAPRIFISVPSGHAGVLWLRFFGGTDVTHPALGEGMHVIFPWDRVFLYVTRVQDKQETFEVISKDGLHFQISVSTRWRLIERNLPLLHRDFGPAYADVLLLPEVSSIARTVISRFDTEAVYSTDRRHIEEEIYNTIVASERTNRIAPIKVDPDDRTDNVSLVDVLITKIALPVNIQLAIARKLEQLLISEEYVFRLASERQEAERKRIEAHGIQDFQSIVQAGISEAYLKWRGIEATLKLATSPNAKVVVIGGGGSQGLPLILNTGDAAAPAPAPAPQKPIVPGPAAGAAPATTEPAGRPAGAAQGEPSATIEPVKDPPTLLRDIAASLGYRLDPLSAPAAPPPAAATPGVNVTPPSRAP